MSKEVTAKKMRAVKNTMESLSRIMDDPHPLPRRRREIADLRATMAKAAADLAVIAAAAADGEAAHDCRVVEGVAVHTSRAVADLLDARWLKNELSSVVGAIQTALADFYHLNCALHELADAEYDENT